MISIVIMKYRQRVKQVAFALLVLIGVAYTSIAVAQSPKEVPNIFTPNGDGINDNLELQSSETMTFMVFNRNGGLVYKAEAKYIVWDGKDERGQEISDGLYFFILKDPANTYTNDKGFIYISRTTVKE